MASGTPSAMKTVLHKQTLGRKAVAFAGSLELWAFALPLLFVLAAFALSASPGLVQAMA